MTYSGKQTLSFNFEKFQAIHCVELFQREIQRESQT